MKETLLNCKRIMSGIIYNMNNFTENQITGEIVTTPHTLTRCTV